METLHDHDLPSILGIKAGDQASLFHQVPAAEEAGRVTYDERHDRAAGLVHRFRCVGVTCRSMSPMRMCASIAWRTGRGGMTRSSTSVGSRTGE